MSVGAEVEQFRKKYRFTVVCMCNAMDMTESEYNQFIHGRYTPAAYQLVWLLIAFRCPLDSIVGKKFIEGLPRK